MATQFGDTSGTLSGTTKEGRPACCRLDRLALRGCYVSCSWKDTAIR